MVCVGHCLRSHFKTLAKCRNQPSNTSSKCVGIVMSRPRVSWSSSHLSNSSSNKNKQKHSASRRGKFPHMKEILVVAHYLNTYGALQAHASWRIDPWYRIVVHHQNICKNVLTTNGRVAYFFQCCMSIVQDSYVGRDMLVLPTLSMMTFTT